MPYVEKPPWTGCSRWILSSQRDRRQCFSRHLRKLNNLPDLINSLKKTNHMLAFPTTCLKNTQQRFGEALTKWIRCCLLNTQKMLLTCGRGPGNWHRQWCLNASDHLPGSLHLRIVGTWRLVALVFLVASYVLTILRSRCMFSDGEFNFYTWYATSLMETADARENSSSSLSFPSPLPFPGGSGWSHIILTIIHSSISTNQYKTNNILHRTSYKYSCDYLGFDFLPHPASCCGPGRTSS